MRRTLCIWRPFQLVMSAAHAERDARRPRSPPDASFDGKKRNFAWRAFAVRPLFTTMRKIYERETFGAPVCVGGSVYLKKRVPQEAHE